MFINFKNCLSASRRWLHANVEKKPRESRVAPHKAGGWGLALGERGEPAQNCATPSPPHIHNSLGQHKGIPLADQRPPGGQEEQGWMHHFHPATVLVPYLGLKPDWKGSRDSASSRILWGCHSPPSAWGRSDENCSGQWNPAMASWGGGGTPAPL